MVFSPRTLVAGNGMTGNTGGILALNSDGLVVRDNRILHAMSASGAAIGLKETDAALIQGNDIVHCAVGILADSPVHPINRITIVGNRIAHTITGVTFYGEKGGHVVRDNRFEHNLADAVLYGSGDPLSNDWTGNDWDDYEGFDRDGDGLGDTPTRCTPTPIESGSRARRRPSSAGRRPWSGWIFSNGWRHSLPRP
jgi:nitrous oxidase accessory protein